MNGMHGSLTNWQTAAHNPEHLDLLKLGWSCSIYRAIRELLSEPFKQESRPLGVIL